MPHREHLKCCGALQAKATVPAAGSEAPIEKDFLEGEQNITVLMDR